MKPKAFQTWFAVGHLANDWPISSLWLIVPTAGAAMDLSPTEVGLLFTIAFSVGALGSLPAGILTDHASDRGRLLIATFWWVAVGYSVAALAPGYWSLALLLAIAGMGNSAWHPISTGVLARESKQQRAEALGMHALGGSLAETLAPLSVGFLLVYMNWRAALLISVLPTVLLGVCFFWIARAVPRVEKTKITKQEMIELLRIWRQGNGMRIVLMLCFYNMAGTALLSMIPLYLASMHHLAPKSIGFTLSALLITGAIVQPLVGKISDIFGRRPVIILGNLTAGTASIALVFQPAFLVMIAAMAIAICAWDSIRAAMLAAAVDHADQREGTTLGLAFLLLEGVSAMGAVFAGIAAEYSWAYMFGLAATFSLAAASLAVMKVSQVSSCVATTPEPRDTA